MNIFNTAAPDPGEVALVLTLQRIWTYQTSTKSDDARVLANEIAEAASRGYITTAIVPSGRIHGRIWKVTPTGLAHLFANPDMLQDEEDRYVALYR